VRSTETGVNDAPQTQQLCGFAPKNTRVKMREPLPFGRPKLAKSDFLKPPALLVFSDFFRKFHKSFSEDGECPTKARLTSTPEEKSTFYQRLADVISCPPRPPGAHPVI